MTDNEYIRMKMNEYGGYRAREEDGVLWTLALLAAFAIVVLWAVL